MDVFHQCRGGHLGCIRPSHLDIAPTGSKIRHVPDPAIGLTRLSEFAERLKREREARRVSKPQFAAELGVNQGTYRSWEAGESAPLADVYHDIAQKLGWDGHLRRFSVVVALERTVEARSAGEAAQSVLDELEVDGRPLKAAVIRTQLRP